MILPLHSGLANRKGIVDVGIALALYLTLFPTVCASGMR